MSMNEELEQFVEKMGLVSEADGMTRIAGRIFGLLFLSDRPRSLEEISDELGVSRASVSVDARRLAQIGVLERVSRPGDRRDYYIISPEGVRHSIELRIQSLRRFQELIRGLHGDALAAPEVRARAADWDEAYSVITAASTELLERLRSRGRRAGENR